jgi:Protein of unknown function (DUF2786)
MQSVTNPQANGNADADWRAILDKLERIKTLAERAATPAEAEAAAAALTKLLTRYNLSMVVLDRRLGARPPANYEQRAVDLGAATRWRRNLLNAIAHHGFCRSWWGGWPTKDYLVGEPENILAVEEMYRHFEAEVIRLADAAWRGHASQRFPWETVRAWKERYRLGCVDGLGAAMARARRAAVGDVADGAALVVVKDAEADAALAKVAPNLTAARERAFGFLETSAYDRGWRDGSALDVERRGAIATEANR